MAYLDCFKRSQKAFGVGTRIADYRWLDLREDLEGMLPFRIFPLLAILW
jgi:hypothetical protein